MESLTMEWPSSVILLEPLRPLSPEIHDNEEITKIGINVDKLSRSEIAGKLLDQLDGFHTEEPEPFDWFTNEKSIDLPIFETLPSPVPYRFENYAKPIHHYSFDVDNVKYEQPTSTSEDDRYDAAQTPPERSPCPIQEDDIDPNAVAFETNEATAPPPPPRPDSSEWLKNETLTPPDSPKDDDILKQLLQDLQPADFEQLAMGQVDDFDTTAAAAAVAPFSENSASVDDEFSEYGGGASSYVASDSGLDDPEWSPPPPSSSNAARPSTGVRGRGGGRSAASKRRTAKPYTKVCAEDRKMKKKEQNKNAATRYRLKKKAECQEIKHEEQLLQEHNDKLRRELEDVSREVRYLKSLMREVYRKRGLIK